jgi:hypothetical protein
MERTIPAIAKPFVLDEPVFGAFLFEIIPRISDTIPNMPPTTQQDVTSAIIPKMKDTMDFPSVVSGGL